MTEPTKQDEQQIKLKVTDSDVAEPGGQVSSESKSLLSMPLEEFLATLDSSSPEHIESLLASERKVKLPARLFSSFLKPLLSVPEGKRSALNVVSWWESRRLVYNLIVGACGLPTLVVLVLTHAVPFWFLGFGTILYAVAANACYTLGWMAELVSRACFAEKSRHMGPMLLTLGLVFSMAITIACALIIPVAFLGVYFGI